MTNNKTSKGFLLDLKNQIRNESKAPDDETKALQDNLANDHAQLVNDSLRQEIHLRNKFADKTYELVYAYIFFVLGFVFLQGIGLFHLSDSVLITLLSTTSITIIGLLASVIKYLFQRQKK